MNINPHFIICETGFNLCINVSGEVTQYDIDMSDVTDVHCTDFKKKFSVLDDDSKIFLREYLDVLKIKQPIIKFRKVSKYLDRIDGKEMLTFRFRSCSLDVRNTLNNVIALCNRLTSPSIIPYFLLTNIAEVALKNFIINSFYRPDIITKYREDHVKTSCILTGFALASFFWGKEEGKNVQDMAFNNKKCEFLPYLISCNDSEPLIIVGLVEGRFYYEYQKSVKNRQLDDSEIKGLIDEISENVWEEFKKIFISRMADFVFKSQKKLSYLEASDLFLNNSCRISNEGLMEICIDVLKTEPFNSLVVNDLRKEVVENISKASDECSFGYFCKIDLPRHGMTRHVFFIEQFNYGEKIYYRMYQSCIGIGSLFEEWKCTKKMMNLDEFLKFLLYLEVLVTPGMPGDRNTAGIYCFGYGYSDESHMGNLVELNGDEWVYSSLRFFSKSFDPQQTIKNLEEIFFNFQT